MGQYRYWPSAVAPNFDFDADPASQNNAEPDPQPLHIIWQ